MEGMESERNRGNKGYKFDERNNDKRCHIFLHSLTIFSCDIERTSITFDFFWVSFTAVTKYEIMSSRSKLNTF